MLWVEGSPPINPSIWLSPKQPFLFKRTLTTSPTTIVDGGFISYCSDKSAIVFMFPTNIRWSGQPAFSTIATGVLRGYLASLTRLSHNSRSLPTAIKKTTVCSLWYWIKSGDVPFLPYPVHITTWLETPLWVTGIPPKRGAAKAAETPFKRNYVRTRFLL